MNMLTSKKLRVALVGAGNIASTHAQILQCIKNLDLSAIVDADLDRSRAFASQWKFARAFSHIDQMLSDSCCDVAHVLVPPALHRNVAENLLLRGIHVLLEKPMAESDADCAALQSAAELGSSFIQVNQNYVWHPTFQRLKHHLNAGVIGRLQHVNCVFSMPLRQLDAGQLGHWMFQSPRNLLLEQAVHPLSQLDDLVGPLELKTVTIAGEPSERDRTSRRWMIACHTHGSVSVQALIALGQRFPVFRISVIGTDGTIEADMIANRLRYDIPSRWMDAINDLTVGMRRIGESFQSIQNAWQYTISSLGLQRRTDPFFESMLASIDSFYASLRGRASEHRGERGRRLVRLCEAIAVATPSSTRPLRPFRQAGRFDVLVTGGTGFIGRNLVAQLLRRGNSRIGVLARAGTGLPPWFDNDRVVLVRGDISNAEAIYAACRGARCVVHLAHGGGTDWAQIERLMVGGADVIARAALSAEVKHFIFVSSIAALFLGNSTTTVDALTQPDPRPDLRGDYARGKIQSEALLNRLRESEGLPLTIVRPGIVLGAGTSPFHSGVGMFSRETHCIGWNHGENGLPFVLVDDVTRALVELIHRTQSDLMIYNLVGDVRPSAREYINELGRRFRRPIRYHPQSAYALAGIECLKWSIKRLSGRRDMARTTLRDIRSRGMVAPFDTSSEKADLNWQPISSQEQFFAQAFPESL